MPDLSDRQIHPLEGVTKENLSITDLEVILLSYRLKPEEEWPDGDDHVVIWQTRNLISFGGKNPPTDAATTRLRTT